MRNMLRCTLIFLTIVFSANSYARDDYNSIKIGKLQGKLLVQWLEPDVFLFIPDKDSPLVFTRSSGDKIIPGRMITDGGSIPRTLWILRNYSPWGYGPAFVVHDWLFEMKHCKYENNQKYSVHDAALVMAEVMKTMMETKKVEVDKLTLWSMFKAVDSSIAKKLWDNGKCNPPPPGMFGAEKPLREFTLNFDE